MCEGASKSEWLRNRNDEQRIAQEEAIEATKKDLKKRKSITDKFNKGGGKVQSKPASEEGGEFTEWLTPEATDKLEKKGLLGWMDRLDEVPTETESETVEEKTEPPKQAKPKKDSKTVEFDTKELKGTNASNKLRKIVEEAKEIGLE